MNIQRIQEMQHRYYLAALALILFPIYCLTAPHFATLEDSGLFIMAAFFKGVAHPPGYPLFVLLGKLFTLIPVDTIAFRVHLLNMVLGTATCCFVYGIIERLTRDRIAAFSGALVLGFSGSFWFQSIVAEVYILQAFFFAVLFYVALDIDERFTVKKLALFFLLLGLSMTNHYPLMILALGAFITLLWNRWREILRHWYIPVVFFIIGLLPYAHLYLARFYSNYSHFYAITGFGEMIRFVTRTDYSFSDVSEAVTIVDSIRFVFFFIGRMMSEFAYAGFVVMIFGFFMAFKNLSRRIFLSLVLGIASSSLFLLLFWRVEYTQLTRDVYRYWQVVPLVCGSIAVGVGLSRIGAIIPSGRIPAAARPAVLMICLVGTAVAVFAGNLKENNIRDDSLGVDYAKITLDSLPRDSVLILYDDADIGPIAYLNQVERFRTDITLTTQTGSGFPERLYNRNADDLTMREESLAYISQKMRAGKRVFTIAPLMYFGAPSDFPYAYVSHGLYSEIVEKAYAGSDPVSDDRLVDKGVSFLDRLNRGGYGNTWSYHRDDIIRKFVILLYEAGRNHPAVRKHWVGKLREAGDLVAREKNFEKADRLYREIIDDVSALFINERLGKHSLFIVNRFTWVNESSMPESEKSRLMQEAIDLSMPLVKKDPRCGNNLALLVLRISRQMPVKIDEAYFQQTFYRCPEFRGSF